MATVKTHKVVAALPGTLEPSALYFVRSGSGFDVYLTNNSGTIVAYTLNQNPGDSATPFFIPEGETFRVPSNKQSFFRVPIDVRGVMIVSGLLIEV